MVKSIVGLMAIVAAMGMATTASAEDLTVSVGAGASEVLDTYNADSLFTHNKFQLGENGVAKAMFKVVGPLAIGVQANGSYFEQAQPNNSTGVIWTFAPTVKLQTTHDAGAYAYIDGAFGPSVQDHIWNAGVLASAGVDFSLEPTRTYWAGPFVSYSHVFDLAGSQSSLLSSHHEMNTAVVGLELAFDFPVKPKTVHDVKVVVVKTPSAPVEDSKPCPTPPVAATPERNPLFVVRFDKSSSVLSAAQTETLDSLVSYMKTNTHKFAVVQGRASSEGPKALNLTLSKARADVVVAYLVAHGIDADRMVASGAGGVGNPNNAANRNAIVIVLR